MLAPRVSMAHILTQTKRSIHQFEKDCNGKITYWTRKTEIIMSSLLSWVAAAKALKQLDGIGCWLSNQTNVTSVALHELLAEVNAVRHATFQNRATIDFLLLAHGHGCGDSEGLCCMNLSDHSEFISCSISLLKEGVGKLQIEQANDWLTHLFKGWNLSTYALSLIKMGLLILLILITLIPDG